MIQRSESPPIELYGEEVKNKPLYQRLVKCEKSLKENLSVVKCYFDGLNEISNNLQLNYNLVHIDDQISVTIIRKIFETNSTFHVK